MGLSAVRASLRLAPDSPELSADSRSAQPLVARSSSAAAPFSAMAVEAVIVCLPKSACSILNARKQGVAAVRMTAVYLPVLRN